MSHLGRYTVAVPGERILEVVEGGKSDGFPGVVHNGTPWRVGLDEECAAEASDIGCRPVTYGRPGYGRSTRMRDRSVASAASDTAALADWLEIGQFAVLGFSGGGPHALACAALLGDRVCRTALLARISPYNGEIVNEKRTYDADEMRESMELTIQELREDTNRNMREGVVYGEDGFIDDWVAFWRPWGVSLRRCDNTTVHLAG